MSDLKNLIKNKATHCFLRFGFRSVTMDDLANQLGISKKTLYQNFTTKEELLHEVLKDKEKERDAKMESFAKSASNPVEMLYGVFQEMLEESEKQSPNYIFDLKKYYHQVWEYFIQKIEKTSIERIKANIKEGKKQGLYRAEINEDIIAGLFYHNAIMFTEQEMIPSNVIQRRTFIKEMLEYHLHGICTDAGRSLIPQYTKKYLIQ